MVGAAILSTDRQATTQRPAGTLSVSILGHAFHLAVEGGTNRGTGLWVAGAGPAHRELIGQVFHRALTELLPPAVSLPLAAEAIRQSAADLAPDTVVQQAVERALEAVGLPPLDLAGGNQTGSAVDNDADERRDAHRSPALAAVPPGPATPAGRPADFDVQATEVGHYNYESPHSNPVDLLPDGSLLWGMAPTSARPSTAPVSASTVNTRHVVTARDATSTTATRFDDDSAT